MKPRIIGIAGRAQHGKDTIGQILAEHHGYQRVAFADKVRELALAIDPWIVISDVEWRLFDLKNVYGWNHAKQFSEVRQLLQSIGEGCRQVLGEQVWIDALFMSLDYSASYVITDVRYLNEAEFIHARGGVVWRVVRLGFDNGVDASHPSESGVSKLQVDAEIVNGGTIGSLRVKVGELLNNAKIKEKSNAGDF